MKHRPPRLNHTLALCFVLLCSLPTVALAETLFEATYKGRHTGIGITMRRTLEQSGDHAYVIKSKATSLVGSISEHSQFDVVDGKFVPKRYDFVRRILGKKSEQSLTFDWLQNEVRYRRKDKPHRNADIALVPDALDPTLYQLKLQQELSAGKELFQFEFAKGGKLKTLDFKITGDESYELDDQRFAAVKVERINHDGKKHTEIWLIPALNYQIAKIVHTEKDGAKHTVRLTRFSANEPALTKFYEAIK